MHSKTDLIATGVAGVVVGLLLGLIIVEVTNSTRIERLQAELHEANAELDEANGQLADVALEKFRESYLARRRAADNSGEESADLRYAGFDWEPHGPLRTSLHAAWEYRAGEARLVEFRELADGWGRYEVFRDLPLLSRQVQAENPTTGKWVDHGPGTLYYPDGSVAWTLSQAGQLVGDQGVKIPAPEWVWDLAE